MSILPIRLLSPPGASDSDLSPHESLEPKLEDGADANDPRVLPLDHSGVEPRMPIDSRIVPRTPFRPGDFGG